jgi:hypothetical protein
MHHGVERKRQAYLQNYPNLIQEGDISEQRRKPSLLVHTDINQPGGAAAPIIVWTSPLRILVLIKPYERQAHQAKPWILKLNPLFGLNMAI